MLPLYMLNTVFLVSRITLSVILHLVSLYLHEQTAAGAGRMFGLYYACKHIHTLE